MRFLVERTSRGINIEDRPCERAEFIKDTGWIVEINSLEELLDFVREIDEPIIIEETCIGWDIEIYDDYRE